MSESLQTDSRSQKNSRGLPAETSGFKNSQNITRFSPDGGGRRFRPLATLWRNSYDRNPPHGLGRRPKKCPRLSQCWAMSTSTSRRIRRAGREFSPRGIGTRHKCHLAQGLPFLILPVVYLPAKRQNRGSGPSIPNRSHDCRRIPTTRACCRMIEMLRAHPSGRLTARAASRGLSHALEETISETEDPRAEADRLADLGTPESRRSRHFATTLVCRP